MKPVNYDKPRIVSTVVISIFLAIALFLCLTMYTVWVKDIKAAAEAAKEGSEDPGGQVAGGIAVAFAGAFLLIFVYMFEIGAAILSAIILPFSINNRKSIHKPVRIISYVYDGLIGAVLLASVLKIVLLSCGV